MRFTDTRPHAKRFLTLLGSFHETDPRMWYYQPALSLFEQWEEDTRGKKRLMIGEGEQDLWGVSQSLEESIRHNYSELGLLCFLAKEFNVPMISGEPPDYSELVHLSKEFPPEENQLYYWLRALPVRARIPESKRPEFRMYMEEVCDVLQRGVGKLALVHSLPDLDFSYENFIIQYKSHFNEEPHPDCPKMNDLFLRFTSAEMEDEAFASQPIARIAKRIMQLRDAHLAALYARHWFANETSIFSWYGINHTLAVSGLMHNFGYPLRRVNGRGTVFQKGYILHEERQRNTAFKMGWTGGVVRTTSVSLHMGERFLALNGEIPSKEKRNAIKTYFAAKANESFCSSPYIEYAAHTYRRWDSYFFGLCRKFEKFAETHIDPLLPEPLGGYMQLYHNRPNALLKAHGRLLFAFKVEPRELTGFTERLGTLSESFFQGATNDGFGMSEAAVAFISASKHLATLRCLMRNIDSMDLTAVEQLRYVVEALDYLEQTKNDVETIIGPVPE